MPKSEKYRRQTHLRAVQKNSRATHKTRTILGILCFESSFDGPFVTITKNQIAELTGVETTRYIQVILKELKAVGTIEVVKNGRGGRGNAVTYKLHDRSYGKPQPALSIAKTPEKTLITLDEFNAAIKEAGGYAGGSKLLDKKYPNGWKFR